MSSVLICNDQNIQKGKPARIFWILRTHLVSLQIVDYALEYRLPTYGHSYVLQEFPELWKIWKRGYGNYY